VNEESPDFEGEVRRKFKKGARNNHAIRKRRSNKKLRGKTLRIMKYRQ
jgi:hypothetical protein